MRHQAQIGGPEGSLREVHHYPASPESCIKSRYEHDDWPEVFELSPLPTLVRPRPTLQCLTVLSVSVA